MAVSYTHLRLEYDARKNGSDNSLLLDACVTELDSLHADIDSLIAEISAVTGEKTCPHCGESVAVGAAYCSKCGAKMDAEPAAEPQPEPIQLEEVRPEAESAEQPENPEQV